MAEERKLNPTTSSYSGRNQQPAHSQPQPQVFPRFSFSQPPLYPDFFSHYYDDDYDDDDDDDDTLLQSDEASSTGEQRKLLISSTTAAPKTTLAATKVLLNDAHNGFEKGNFVCSPFSLEILMGMLAAGAEGKTLKQLLDFLGHETMDQLHSESPCSKLLEQLLTNPNGGGGSLDSSLAKGFSSPNQFGLPDGFRLANPSNLANEVSLANGIWVDKNLNIQSCYEEVLRTVYRTQARFVDFENRPESARKINSWVSKNTKGLIPAIVDEKVLKDVAIVLANALYFKGVWSTAFDVKMTRIKDFHLINGQTVSIPFMTSKEDFRYGSFEGLKILQLPYKSEGQLKRFSMYILLPDRKDGLHDLLELFDSDHALFHTKFDLSPRPLTRLWIPKFKISYKFEPRDVMEQMGLTLPFDPMNMELTRIVVPEDPDSDKLYVSNILQQSVIEVDEKGTVATAASFMGMSFGGVAPSFVADHPFMFMIREETSLAILFMGVVLNPCAE